MNEQWTEGQWTIWVCECGEIFRSEPRRTATIKHDCTEVEVVPASVLQAAEARVKELGNELYDEQGESRIEHHRAAHYHAAKRVKELEEALERIASGRTSPDQASHVARAALAEPERKHGPD